jgi:hypothetical protein
MTGSRRAFTVCLGRNKAQLKLRSYALCSFGPSWGGNRTFGFPSWGRRGIFMVPLLLLGGLVGTAQEATGTSIVGVMATGISGSIGYFLRRQNPWQISLALVPGALGGSYLGAF